MLGNFNVSGFLFHVPTQKILLQQSAPSEEISLFSGTGLPNEKTVETFQRIIHEKLKIKLPAKAIHPIYNYQHSTTKKTHHVFYAEITTKEPPVASNEKNGAAWFQFKVLYKAKLPKDLLQDLIVGQRVINAEMRLTQ